MNRKGREELPIAERLAKDIANAQAQSDLEWLQNAIKRLQDAAAEKDCKGWLSMARNFIKSSMPEKARPYLGQVIQKYPDTSYAAEARELLAAMPKAGGK